MEFELRKLEAQQALQLVDLFKTFMPNSFLVSGGEEEGGQVGKEGEGREGVVWGREKVD